MLTLTRVENFAEFYANYKDCVEEHYKNFADTYGDTRQLNIDFNLYQQLVDMGVSNIFIVEADKKFIGYLSVDIVPNVLFKNNVDASINHLYITKESRGKNYVTEILEKVFAYLKQKFVTKVSISFPALNTYEDYAKSLGFVPYNRSYIIDLGDK